MKSESVFAFIQKIFLPVVTAGTAVMVGVLNYSISQVDADLRQRIAEVDLARKAAREVREKLSLERDFHFTVYERVHDSIEENNEKKQAAAKAFVLVMVEGDLRRHLLGVLESAGTPTIRAQTREVIAKEAAFENESRQLSAWARPIGPSFDWEDWDYDVFWCAASGDIAKRQAEMVARQLEKEGAEGRIRVRELPESINARAG